MLGTIQMGWVLMMCDEFTVYVMSWMRLSF